MTVSVLPTLRRAADLFRRYSSAVFDGIEIYGRSEFLARTREALGLLKRRPEFALIVSQIAVIRQGRRSGMHARSRKPTFVVGPRTWRHSAHWYAGAIAHDAYHAKLYHDAKSVRGGAEPHPDTWTGGGAEKQCLAFQRQILMALDADPNTIACIEKHAIDPRYQGRNQGWGAWLDYLQRGW